MDSVGSNHYCLFQRNDRDASGTRGLHNSTRTASAGETHRGLVVDMGIIWKNERTPRAMLVVGVDELIAQVVKYRIASSLSIRAPYTVRYENNVGPEATSVGVKFAPKRGNVS
jgi:hypothetical protein